MKTFKKLTALVLAIVMCVALCSCTLANKAKIHEDGTITMQVKCSLSEDEVKTIETSMHDETALDEFTKESDKKGWTETVDGVKYYAIITEVTEDMGMTVKDLAESLAFPCNITTTDFWIYANSTNTQTESEYDAIIKNAGLNIHTQMTFIFPYKVIETNGVKVDDYTITYDEKLDGNYIYAITEKSTADWTKAEDKAAAFKEMAKIQCTPKKIKGVKIVYKSANALRVSWNEPQSNFISGYVIERKVGNGAFEQIKKVGYLSANYDRTGKLCIVDKKVTAGKTYSYRVKAFYKDAEFDLTGEYSDAKSIKFTNINKTPKFKLTVKGKKAIVKIKNFDKSVVGYQIKYSSNKNFKRAKTVNTRTANATIKGLDTTKPYYVKVRKFVKGTTKNVYGKFSKVSKIIYA